MPAFAGANSGIGFEAAKKLSKLGHEVTAMLSFTSGLSCRTLSVASPPFAQEELAEGDRARATRGACDYIVFPGV
jgi:NAD(P)-dependent dehydrogenase (short-subunit alcohol dehydrogenase family)